MCYVGVDLNCAIEVLSALCTTVLAAVKGMRWWTHRHQLYNILRQLLVQAYLSYLSHRNTNDSFDYYHTTVYAAAYPFAIETLKKFCAVVTYQQVTASMACIYWASSDTLFAQLVLAKRLENIIADDDNFKNDDVIRQQLENIVKQHRQLFEMFLSYLSHRNINDSFDYYHTTVYPAVYPFGIETFRRFCAIVTYQQIAACIVCVYWVSSDTLFAQLVLANRLENIIADDDNFKNDDAIRQQLENIARQHRQLFQMYLSYLSHRNTNDSFDYYHTTVNPAVYPFDIETLGRFCAVVTYQQITASIVCVYWASSDTLFAQLVLGRRLENIIADDDNFKNDDVIRQQLENIAKQHRIVKQVCHAAYRSQWIEWSKENKMLLMIIMMRAAKEYECTSYGMISLNLKQVTTIANGALSYFMLLKRFG
ncbi:hypothetical protein PV327_006581 [Microctonus hyperodae]|uniref:Odorant receptor n=1 Tax=Microctonus hyperodae TaxID=165561 RepID=A0AA39KIM7_MICHY|nr:hypothetical protein PV327_006581 [Microctonus hyperodae]